MAVTLSNAAGVSGGPKLVASVTTPATITGTTVDSLLASVVVPAGTVKPGGCLDISPLMSFGAGTANNKRHRVVIGGVDVINLLQTGNLSSSQICRVRNTGTLTVGPNAAAGTGLGHAAGAIVSVSSGAINWDVDQTVEVRGQLTVGTDSITLQSLLVEVINP